MGFDSLPLSFAPVQPSTATIHAADKESGSMRADGFTYKLSSDGWCPMPLTGHIYNLLCQLSCIK